MDAEGQVGGPPARRWRRDEILRMSMFDIRKDFPAKQFKTMTRVRLEHLGHVAFVELVDEPFPTSHGHRRWLRCPKCSRRAQTVGCHPVEGWACAARACGGWRGAGRVRTTALD